MKILISSRVEKSAYNETWYVFEYSLIKFLNETWPKAQIVCALIGEKNIPNDYDLLVIPGGSTPGENIQRDNYEKQLILDARQKGKKILGICRGAQLLASIDGAILEMAEGHIGVERNLDRNIKLSGICFHNWAIFDLKESWQILSRDIVDGSIEIFCSKDKNELAIMSHPERLESVVDVAENLGVFFDFT